MVKKEGKKSKIEKNSKNKKITTTNRRQKSKNKNNDKKTKSKNNQNKSVNIPKGNNEKTAVTNGEIELDQAVEDTDRYIIVSAKPSEYSDKYYAVTLNYTNVQNNNNKFYITPSRYSY